MAKIKAGISTSLDGYITGPNDRPGQGLGEGGERLHYWVFGGPWTYAEEPHGEPTGADKEVLDQAMANVGSVICGRNTYEAAGTWGGKNTWGIAVAVLTHNPPDPPLEGFHYPTSFDEAIQWSLEQAHGKDVYIMGGASVIRQALGAGIVDELSISIAPVVLGGGKRLFDTFDQSMDLEHLRVSQSPFATHLTYRVVR